MGAVSDERTGLSFTSAAGPRQRSHSRIRVLWDSRPYFTVSDSRLFLASYDSQGYGGGIRPRLHTGLPPNSFQFVQVATCRHGPRRKHSFQQFIYRFIRIRCSGNVFIELFPSSGRLFLLKICWLAVNVVSLSVSKSLRDNGSARCNMFSSM
jgi:hypothetical protein